ncbi:hypothetical protein ACF0H5_018543 [Mactra antiquata]
MKVVLCLLALVAVAMSRNIEVDERFLFSLDDVVNALQSALGSDITEAACEATCPTVLSAIPGASLASFLCAPACQQLQKLG